MMLYVLLCNFRGNYYVPFNENICSLICTDDIVFLHKSVLHLTKATGLIFIALRLCCSAYNGIVALLNTLYLYIYYDIGMMGEISFARVSCIIFLAASTSSLFASAHIALTVAVSDIISDSGITPISSKSLPVS